MRKHRFSRKSALASTRLRLIFIIFEFFLMNTEFAELGVFLIKNSFLRALSASAVSFLTNQYDQFSETSISTPSGSDI
jgi:hypothetical protein